MKDYTPFLKTTDLKGESAAAGRFLRALQAAQSRALGAQSPVEALRFFVQDCGRACAAQSAGVISCAGEGRAQTICTFDSRGGNVLPPQELVEELVSLWREPERERRFLLIGDVRQLGAELRESLESRGVRTLAAFPLVSGGRLLGLALWENLDPGQEDAPAALQMAMDFLCLLLQRVQALQREQSGEQSDPVTGLMSVPRFLERLGELQGRIAAGECGTPMDVLCFDIEKFVVFNSQHGFSRGDQLLRAFGELLQRIIGTDLVTRHYGDHFYAVCESSRSEQVVEQVHEILFNDHLRFGVKVRAGIYTLGDARVSASGAVDRAGLAGNHAVGDFTSYYRRFRPEMESVITRANYLVDHIDDALSCGWIQVYYQPIVSTISRRVSSVEALARWQDPVYGFLSPDIFLDTLEVGHLLYKLDLHVIERVCLDLRSRMNEGLPCVPVSVNLSRKDLEIEDLHEKINAILTRCTIPHSLIRIEITESALVSDENRILEEIAHFHRDGYQVWLDDFGSGYSSLGTLQHHSFDLLKVDMVFLRSANEKTPVVLTDIIDMAKRLGIATLIEGVETKEEYDFVRSIGCSQVQGFYFSRPVPVDELFPLLQRRHLELEDLRDAQFFGEIGRVNILDAINPLCRPGEMRLGTRIPMAVLALDGTCGEILYANASWQQFSPELQEWTERKFDLSELGRSVRDALRSAQERRGPVTCVFALGQHMGQMEVSLITAQGRRRAFLLSMISISVRSRAADFDADRIRDFHAFVDRAELIDPGQDRLQHLYGELDGAGELEQRTLREALAGYAQGQILPAERSSFLLFTNPGTLSRRIDGAAGRSAHRYFHLLMPDGTYAWRRVVLSEVTSGEGPRTYLLSVAREQEPEDREGSDLPLPGELLWENLWERGDVGLYWKDPQGRLQGANQAFLDYLQRDLSDLVGKSAREITGGVRGILPLAGRESEPQLAVHGKNIAGGTLRRALISQVPVMERGKLLGAVGVVTDVSAVSDQSAGRRGEIDPLTGLPNLHGIAERARELEAIRQDGGRSYALIILQIRDPEHCAGEDAAALSRWISSVLEPVLQGHDPVLGFSFAGRYSLLVSCADTAERQELERQVGETLSTTPLEAAGAETGTLYVMTGSALCTEVPTFEDLLTLAQSRLSLCDPRAFRERRWVDYQFDEIRIQELMRAYSAFFDIVRLVDPVHHRARALGKTGELFSYPYMCYELLEKSAPCINCISSRTVQSHKSFEKIEIVGGRSYFAVSRYVELDGAPCALEGLREIHEFVADDGSSGGSCAAVRPVPGPELTEGK